MGGLESGWRDGHDHGGNGHVSSSRGGKLTLSDRPTRWVRRPDGVRLATWERGEGEPVVLINGLGASARDWGPVLELLARNRRVIVFDNRGAGASRVPDVPMTLEELAADAAAVFEAYGLESADLIGYSMGGMIAQILAVRQPERIRRLVLMATHAGARAAIRSAPRARAVLSPTDDQPREEVARMQYEAFVAADFATREPEAFQRMLSIRLARLAPLHSWRRQLEAIKESDRVELVREIEVPTLILHGEEDPLVPFGNGEMLNDLIPESRLVSLPGCGHMLSWEKPHAVVEAVEEFL